MHSPEIVEASVDDLEGVRSLLEASQFKPHRFARTIPNDDLAAFWLGSIADRRESDARAFVSRVQGAVRGFAVLQPLAWESRVLGHRIWGIPELVVASGSADCRDTLDAILRRVKSAASESGAETLHCKRFTDDVAAFQALERAGFALVDTQLVYVYTFGDATSPSPAASREARCRLRLAAERDLEPLLEVARAGFRSHFGRFHSDERLGPETSSRVYEEWVRSSLAGYADYFVVAEVDGRIAAYSVWRMPSTREAVLSTRVGHYSIGAVHPDFYRRGVFTEITRYGVALLRGSADCVLGPTHVNNYGVQRGYARLGWHIVDATHTFHAWIR